MYLISRHFFLKIFKRRLFMINKDSFFSIFSNYGAYNQQVQDQGYQLLVEMKSSPKRLFEYYAFAAEILDEHLVLYRNNANCNINALKAMVFDMQRTIFEKNNYDYYSEFYDSLNREGIIDKLLQSSFMFQTISHNDLILMFSDLTCYLLFLKFNFEEIDVTSHFEYVISFFNDPKNDIYHRIGILKSISTLNHITKTVVDSKTIVKNRNRSNVKSREKIYFENVCSMSFNFFIQVYLLFRNMIENGLYGTVHITTELFNYMTSLVKSKQFFAKLLDLLRNNGILLGDFAENMSLTITNPCNQHFQNEEDFLKYYSSAITFFLELFLAIYDMDEDPSMSLNQIFSLCLNILGLMDNSLEKQSSTKFNIMLLEKFWIVIADMEVKRRKMNNLKNQARQLYNNFTGRSADEMLFKIKPNLRHLDLIQEYVALSHFKILERLVKLHVGESLDIPENEHDLLNFIYTFLRKLFCFCGRDRIAILVEKLEQLFSQHQDHLKQFRCFAPHLIFYKRTKHETTNYVYCQFYPHIIQSIKETLENPTSLPPVRTIQSIFTSVYAISSNYLVLDHNDYASVIQYVDLFLEDENIAQHALYCFEGLVRFSVLRMFAEDQKILLNYIINFSRKCLAKSDELNLIRRSYYILFLYVKDVTRSNMETQIRDIVNSALARLEAECKKYDCNSPKLIYTQANITGNLWIIKGVFNKNEKSFFLSYPDIPQNAANTLMSYFEKYPCLRKDDPIQIIDCIIKAFTFCETYDHSLIERSINIFEDAYCLKDQQMISNVLYNLAGIFDSLKMKKSFAAFLRMLRENYVGQLLDRIQDIITNQLNYYNNISQTHIARATAQIIGTFYSREDEIETSYFHFFFDYAHKSIERIRPSIYRNERSEETSELTSLFEALFSIYVSLYSSIKYENKDIYDKTRFRKVIDQLKPIADEPIFPKEVSYRLFLSLRELASLWSYNGNIVINNSQCIYVSLWALGKMPENYRKEIEEGIRFITSR